MKIEIEAVIPEGYESIGEYKIPKRAEPYLLSDGSVGVSDGHLTSPRIILREKKSTVTEVTDPCEFIKSLKDKGWKLEMRDLSFTQEPLNPMCTASGAWISAAVDQNIEFKVIGNRITC